MGLLQRGIERHSSVLAQNESVAVTIRRGGFSTTGVRAVPGRTTAIKDDGDVVIEMTCRDFLILTSAYVIDGDAVLPEAGDLIEEAAIVDGGPLPTFEVLPFAGEPQQRYSDPYRKMLRIHTKEVSPVEDVSEDANKRAAAWSLFWNPVFPDGELDEFDRRQSWGGYPI
jgi:hypothetical protein